MTSLRVTDHPVLGPDNHRETMSFTFDNQTFTALEGDTIASALLVNGVRTLRLQEESGSPRGFYCNIGHCFECRVTVNGIEGVRACLTPITEAMIVESGKKLPTPFETSEQR